jgi:hypothetical protein
MRCEPNSVDSLRSDFRKADRRIAEMKDDTKFDLGGYVELTDLGRQWAARIQVIEGTTERNA